MPISGMEPAKPAQAGRFRLEERASSDGSGDVHRAVEVEGGRAAIVHILRTAGGGARRDRLLREVKRAAQVTHEGLAAVLEVGETAAGEIFVAVEACAPPRLSDRLASGRPLEEREAAGIAAQIARALEAAHDAGVVHRDLRPSLVVLDGEGETTRVKVEGLATPRLVDIAEDDPEAPFASPEQRRGGRGESVGRRADVYSIGAMLYAMLTGRGPESSAPPLASALGDVVRRCLAEDPRERFLDTLALGAALRAAMESADPRVSSRPPPTPPTRVSARPPAPSPASARPPAPSPASVRPPAVAPSPISERPPPSSHRPSQRPNAEAPHARAPAAPPPRPLGRPLTARPRWEEALLDLNDGPLPRVAVLAIIAFVIARILTTGVVPYVIAVAAGVAAYATKVIRRPGGDRERRDD